MSLEKIKKEVPCTRCLKGMMKFKESWSPDHVYFQCENCGIIDEIAIIESPKGVAHMTLIVKDWEEVLDEVIPQTISQLNNSAQNLQKWRDRNPNSLFLLQKAVWGWKECQSLIYCYPMKSISKNPKIEFPWQFTFLEADRELLGSRCFATLGFYKNAIQSLRSFLELALLGLYFFETQDKKYFKEWFLGTKKAPPITGDSGIIKILSRKNKILTDVDKRINWTQKITKNYAFLSNFTHSRGKKHSNVWLWQKSKASFSTESWEKWIDVAVETIELISIAVISLFPNALLPVNHFKKFGFDGPANFYLDFVQVQNVRNIFSRKEYLKVLIDCIDTEKPLKEFEKVPNLSDKEIENTMKKFINSVKIPHYRAKIIKIFKDKRFEFSPTVQWSMLLNLQQVIVNEISLMRLAEALELIKIKK